MRALLLPMVAAALAGCANVPMAQVPQHLFADALFPRPAQPTDGADLFALDDAMRDFARTRIVPGVEYRDLQAGRLAQALKDELKLDYDSAGTRSAAETFASRSGNCLSLVILAGAFARHLGIPVAFQSVHGADTWSRTAGIAFLSGHVNLKLRTGAQDDLTIDFMDEAEAARFATRLVAEDTIRAMYLNNRAAEAVAAADPSAYWWARAAVEAAPAYLSATNTLGVIYLRHGHLREAERALRYVLEREPANVRALTNLIHVLRRDQRFAEAGELKARLADVEPYPPFYFLDRGLEALASGDGDTARSLLNRELRRMPYHEEVHFALALADLQVGALRRARKHLGLAVKYSTTRDRRNLYGAKLAHLEALKAR